MKKFLILVLITSIALLAGCKKTNPLIGTWDGSVNGAQMNMTFEEAGTFNERVTLPNPMGGAEWHAGGSGTYTTEGEKLTLKVTAVDVKELPAMAQSMAEKQLKDAASQEVTYKVDGDTLTMTTKAGVVTFTRKK